MNQKDLIKYVKTLNGDLHLKDKCLFQNCLFFVYFECDATCSTRAAPAIACYPFYSNKQRPQLGRLII